MRTYDSDIVLKATAQVAEELKGLPPEIWLLDKNNVALTNASGDVALFESRQPGVFCGHYFFHSRGKEAESAAREFLTEFFSTYGTVIIGFTPLHKKGALWLTQRLGFRSMGDEFIDGKEHRVFILTRKDFL